MEREQRESETHILVIPFPAQGHINPMLQFSKRLASKGLKVTLVNTNSACKFLQTQATSSINIESIFVGFEEGIKPESIEEYLKHFKTIVSQSLVELIEKQNGSKYPIKFLVYDSNMPWALDLARQLGIGAAPFFTQSYIVNSIYYHLHKGTLKIPLDGSMVSLPSMPLLEINDLPSLVYDTGLYPTIVKLTMSQFHNLQEANCIFLNTFDKLEEEGHINPLFQFSKRLASKGLKVTLVTTTSISKSMQRKASSINIETISDVSIEGIKLEDLEEYLQRFRVVVSQSLFELIERQNNSKNPAKFLIYDSVMPWAVDVARRLGLEAAPFFTQPCAVNAIYYHLHQGALKIPLEGSMVSLPSMPLLENNDLPFLDNLATLKLLVNQFSNFQEPNCLLFNTFDTLEDEVTSMILSINIFYA